MDGSLCLCLGFGCVYEMMKPLYVAKAWNLLSYFKIYNPVSYPSSV